MKLHRSLATSCAPRIFCGLALWCVLAAAQGKALNISYLDGQVPVAPESITTIGADLFGDRASLFNGSLEFEHTDLSLPGNSSLPVLLARRFTAGRSMDVRGALGDWDLDVPRFGGIFSSPGWTMQFRGANRCTSYGFPTPPYRFIANDFWQGNTLSIPGQGAQAVFARNTAHATVPADGNTWALMTRNHWHLRCLPNIQNGSGEGFEAISPDGVRYRFDWMATRELRSVRKNGYEAARVEHFLMATQVSDRFGNWVRYTYDSASPLLLRRIEANDGRVIELTHAGGRIASGSDGTRTIQYSYGANGRLGQALLPDGSSWSFNLGGLTDEFQESLGEDANCEFAGGFPSELMTGSMTHPSSAVGTFTMGFVTHGRSHVQRRCRFIPQTNTTTGAVWPKASVSQSLLLKRIEGPGLAPMVWSYIYSSLGSWDTCTTCSDRKTVQVIEPSGAATQHIFGIRWRATEGQLLQVNEGWTGSGGLRTTNFRYRLPTGQAFVDQFGGDGLLNSDWLASRFRPQDQRVVTQQGTTFTWEAAAGAQGFDPLARALRVTLASSLGYTKAETTTYFDHPGQWVMGQVASVTDNWGLVQHSTSYDPITALPIAKHSFGLLKESYTHYPDGTLYQRLDPLGRATTRANYKRGIPQNVTHRDNTQESGTVNNLGKVESHTNEAGVITYFGYDNMGRLNRVFYPSEASLNYFHTEQTHEAVSTPEFGLAAGHWRQTTSTGSARTVRYYDALWRVRLIQTSDVRDESGTAKVVEFRYDHDGHKTFESYPQRTLASVDTAVAGRFWLYDGLNRVLQVRQNSEVGDLTTTTEYLTGFQRRVTNPRGYVSTFNFQAYDQPSEDLVAGVFSPDNNWLAIYRDIHGKPLSIVRGGTYAGAAQQATRSYFYDAQQRLCKTIEPETGATVQAYDGAGNLAWRASGLNQISSSCYEAAMPEASLVRFGYDARDRLTLTAYGDGSPGIGRNYTADGLPYQLWTGASVWTYNYNNRRLKTQETLYYAGQFYPFFWTVDAHGSVSALDYPNGLSVQYAPDALGHPTQVSGFASNVRTHPNGAVAGYTLANGVARTVTQNTRGLPELLTDAGVLNDRYLYDSNGNVSSITDVLEGLNSRTMGYDGMDRLTAVTSLWGNGSYGYDALDNLRTSTVGSRSTVATLDAASNRLTQLNVNGQALNFGYDANGNLTQRGSQGFTFDIGNRLSSAPGKANAYAYDGHGRRAWVQYANGATKLQAYGQAGKLLLSVDSVAGSTNHIYLGDKLLAEVKSLGGSPTTTFSHTDALGSPAARTSSAGQLLSRTRYEAYGATAAGTNPTEIGFTGHVNDADTGLVYMQQRYYDPIAGRFLSVDPVTTDAKTGSSFNKYVYGNNNPYKYKDPDGQFAQVAAVGAGLLLVGAAICDSCRQSLTNGISAVASAIGRMFNQSDSGGGQSNGGASGQSGSNSSSSGGNTNPYKGPVSEPVVVVDQNGNAIPVGTGQGVSSSPNGDYQQVTGSNGKPTGDRLDRGGHKGQSDPKAQGPHGHRVDDKGQPITTPDGNRHLPINPPKPEVKQQ